MAITLAEGPSKRGYIPAFTLGHDPQEGKKPRVFDAGRACCFCGALLTKYNKGPNCYAHSKVKYRTARGQRSDAAKN